MRSAPRTAIEIAKEARRLPPGSTIVVTPEELELLDEVASDPDRREHCTKVNGATVYVEHPDGTRTKPGGPVWDTELEYTGP